MSLTTSIVSRQPQRQPIGGIIENPRSPKAPWVLDESGATRTPDVSDVSKAKTEDFQLFGGLLNSSVTDFGLISVAKKYGMGLISIFQ